MKNKILAIAAIFAVMVSMIGVAAARPEDITISPGGSITVPYSPSSVSRTVTVFNIEDMAATHDIKATVTGTGASGSTSDLEFRFTNEAAVTSGWIGSGVTWNWGTPSGSDEVLTLEIRAVSGAPQDNAYSIEIYDDGGTLNGGAPEYASLTTSGVTIPEFATIAIPIAAMLGLVFFFQQRKNKQE